MNWTLQYKSVQIKTVITGMGTIALETKMPLTITTSKLEREVNRLLRLRLIWKIGRYLMLLQAFLLKFFVLGEEEELNGFVH